jgi:hypothetical protein
MGFRAFTESLSSYSVEDAAEMTRRTDEAIRTAQALGQRGRVKKLAHLKHFLETGQLPRPGGGRGRKALVALARNLITRQLILPEQVQEPPAMPGADAAGRKTFRSVLDHLRERDDLDDLPSFLHALGVQAAAARREGRGKLEGKLLAMKDFLGGRRLRKSAAGRTHMKSFSAEMVGRGLIAPGRIPFDR